jgi:hypothetical protein
MSRDTIFTMCSHTFILFLFRKASVSVETYQLSFHVLIWFICGFHPETSSFFRWEFSLFVPIFVLSFKYVWLYMSCRYVMVIIFSAGRELEGDSRGYRSAEEQARELTRSIRREVNKLSEKWNALIDRSDQWQRKLDDSLAVSRHESSLFSRYPLWDPTFATKISIHIDVSFTGKNV